MHLSHRDYQVAWICALPLEAAAATVILDKEHASLSQPSSDQNTYTLGEVSGYNVVIACLPSGIYGTVSATATIIQLRSTFTAIRFALMVGIGGGVPNDEKDIRLGDVVVSKPIGIFGGVVQYDIGKAVQDQPFQRVGALNKPPPFLLSAMGNLESKYLVGKSQLSQIISDALEQSSYIKERFQRPGGESKDRLFRPTYGHRAGQNTCIDCAPDQLVKRKARIPDEPIVYGGLIASGNEVIKDARVRDQLAEALPGILCFEMEAAGLMDHIPSIVIRGICDYSDSHKNKSWQPYAALTAAAYAKELLSTIPNEEAGKRWFHIIISANYFHSVPVPSLRNPLHSLPPSSRNYTLSVETERKLAGTLAFLAYSKDDVDHIPALCLQEDLDSTVLTVLIAVNKRTFNDGAEAIRRISQGFENIFSILATVSPESNSANGMQRQVLTAVVSMCSSRILSRLRISGKRHGEKRAFKASLQEAVSAVTKLTESKLRSRGLATVAKEFTTAARMVKKLIDSWTQYQVDTRLIDIVEGLHQIQQIEQVPELINIIPNQDMAPTSRQSLLNIIGKISRYWECARFLYRTAKKIPVARKLRVHPVHLPKTAFDNPVLDKNYRPDLGSKILQASSKGHQQKFLREVCTVLGLDQQDASDQFSVQVMKTLTQSKVHAEVQLIAHCELQHPELLPRVICSNKDACYLCNLFIQVYQKIKTPRSHGRLYPGWRLPRLPQLTEVEQSFCQALEEGFQKSCATLLSARRRASHPQPIESTLFTLPLSSTTIKDSPSGTDEEERSSRNAFDSDTQSTRGIIETTNGCPPRMNRSLNQLSLSPINTTLIQGAKELGCLAPGETSKAYRTGPLRVQIEHATSSKNLEYGVRWLSTVEATDLDRDLLAMIDVEGINDEVTLHNRNVFYLLVKGAVVEISCVSVDPL